MLTIRVQSPLEPRHHFIYFNALGLKQKKKMAKSSVLFSLCSLLMAAMFAYSASVQLNDPGTSVAMSINT